MAKSPAHERIRLQTKSETEWEPHSVIFGPGLSPFVPRCDSGVNVRRNHDTRPMAHKHHALPPKLSTQLPALAATTLCDLHTPTSQPSSVPKPLSNGRRCPRRVRILGVADVVHTHTLDIDTGFLCRTSTIFQVVIRTAAARAQMIDGAFAQRYPVLGCKPYQRAATILFDLGGVT